MRSGGYPHGDMPGDKICIGEEHIRKARTIYPRLREDGGSAGKATVIPCCGGSGVGKSEIASVLAYYLNQEGIGAYIMSGDNYPRRIPRDNDLERVRVFRQGGLYGLVDHDLLTPEVRRTLRGSGRRTEGRGSRRRKPWLAVYQQAGRRALTGYLGTPDETDFDEVTEILARFHQGDPAIYLKRMGRETTELWYDKVDFSDTRVLILEWTHGNSDYLEGVDIPILLNSTPAETLAHRRARNRDGKTDSAFTTMVLEIEQKKLEAQAYKAKIILSKQGEILSYADYRRLMANGMKEERSHEQRNYAQRLSGQPGRNPEGYRGPAGEKPEMQGAFRSFYILTSLFTTDLDRGFSVISYDLDQRLTAPGDMERLKALGMDLKLDFILNHLSVQSPQFQDILKRGSSRPTGTSSSTGTGSGKARADDGGGLYPAR